MDRVMLTGFFGEAAHKSVGKVRWLEEGELGRERRSNPPQQILSQVRKGLVHSVGNAIRTR